MVRKATGCKSAAPAESVCDDLEGKVSAEEDHSDGNGAENKDADPLAAEDEAIDVAAKWDIWPPTDVDL